ncbi:neurofilament heavy polypeptide-like isoform X2 [Watersipora subatra]|uniref:neurofilament heavy polypeptide-like isoform X2 n=1 Tax=Watersipora subatra TaxID=2589382 RepID=UPI00355ADB50
MSGNPTHVVVAVQRAKDLISKGKNGTNDAFVTIALHDKKFQTTIKDKVIDPEWYEECDVPLPENYNEHKLTLQVFHRNNLGIDEFLGHLEVPLQNFDVYDPPKSIWYSLLCKPGQNKTKPRGELEVRMSFEIKKVKDFDAMSTASAASRRFKMRRKIKGPKPEKTSDYVHVPDLTGLDAGALGMEDIAENYASPVVNVTKKRLSATSDSLSLPPSSPAFQRSSPRSSKGYSPFNARRRSQGEHDTPPSSNASTEDVKQRTEDAESMDSQSFNRTHRRGGSGSDVLQTKPNRRLLTSRPKSSSTVDINSAVSGEFDLIAERPGAGTEDSTAKGRLRSATSASQLSAGALPEVVEDSKEMSSSSQQIKGGLPAPDEPELVDDDSDDSLAGYSPSPIAPIIRKEEPTDLFTRLDAQMKREQEDDFPIVKHHAEPGEKIFGSVATPVKPNDTAAHSTPIAAEPAITAVSKHKKKEKIKEKVLTPPSDLFNLIMASDEPEYDVDATLPHNSKLIPPEEENPFLEENVGSNDVIEDDERSSTKEEPVKRLLTAFRDTQEEDSSVKKSVSHQPEPVAVSLKSLIPDHESKDSRIEEEAIRKAADLRSSPNSEQHGNEVSSAGANPFEDESVEANTSQNPFEDTNGTVDTANPFENDNLYKDSPMKSISTDRADDRPENPFEVTNSLEQTTSRAVETVETKLSASVNPFESSNNPFEDDEEELESSSFDRVGSFTRTGSSRFASAKPRKRREVKKAAAPPPPKPRRSFIEADTEESTDKPYESLLDTKKNLPDVAVQSPKHKYKKVKKAPDTPGHPVVSTTDSPRGRSSSFNPGSSSTNLAATENNDKRRDTDVGRVESVIHNKSSPNHVKAASPGSMYPQNKCERQPAVGAEAPDVPVEPRVTFEVGVQTEDSTLPAEFSSKSKKELVEMIKKLRAQVRKGEDHAKDLEEYIDGLVVRVMTTDPNLLVTQGSCSKQAHQAGRI